MKILIAILMFAALTACPLAGHADNSIESDPAYLPIDKAIDLKAIPPQVNVNLPRFLLKDALSGLTNMPNNPLAASGIDLGDVLKDVKLIRVVVMEIAKTNRSSVEKSVKALRNELDSKWTSIVSVPDEKSSVGVYAMGDPSGESAAGIAVLVADEGNVVIVNIVGHVSIGKLMKIAMQSNKLPKNLFKQFQGGNGGQQGVTVSGTHSGSKADHDATNQPVETSEQKQKEAAKNK